MKQNRASLLVIALLSTLLLGGCSGGSDSTASAEDEKMFKNPVKGTAPTAEQLKQSASVPSHIGDASGSIPVKGSTTASGAPPPDAMKPPAAPGG